MVDTANRIRARQTALETPMTPSAIEAVEHIIREAASLLDAACAETKRNDGSLGILAAKLADAHHAIESAANKLFTDAETAFPVKDISVYGLSTAAKDGDDYACGVIAMGEPICPRTKHLI